MEYICSQFPIDLEIQLSQAKIAQKNGFGSAQCSRALSDPIAKYRGHYNPASDVLQDFQESHRVKNTHNESVNTIESNYGIAD